MEYLDTKIIEILGGMEKFLELPVYELDNTHFGPLRDYIDFIRYRDVPHPIMRGIDKYNRNFIVLKLQLTETFDPDPDAEGEEPQIHLITVVLFQRYTNESMWVTGSCPCGIYDFLFTQRTNYERLKQLLSQ